LPRRGRDRHDGEAAAPVRAFWSGTITFGLVNIPVDLFAAVRGRRKSMHMVDARGRPLGRRYVCSKDGKPLSPQDIVRGYETDGGDWVVVTDAELEAVAPEMSRDIELRGFVPLGQIPPMQYVRPYFLAPAGRSSKAYHLLAKTMERTGRVGIGRLVMRDHEYLVAILSDHGILRAETLRFSGELRTPRDLGLPDVAKAPARLVKQFEKEIDRLARDALDPDELEDREAQALAELAQAKRRKGVDVIETPEAADEEEPGAQIIDLMERLRRSVSKRAVVRTAEAARARA
jgi:DNA end-binding protein Ku